MLEKWNQFYILQSSQLKYIQDIKNDKMILESILNNNSKINLKGAGYFSDYGKGNSEMSYLKSRFSREQSLLKLYDLKKRTIETLYNYKIDIDDSEHEVNRNTFRFQKKCFSCEYLNYIYINEFLDTIIEEKELNSFSYILYSKKKNLNENEASKLEKYKLQIEDYIINSIKNEEDYSGYSLLISLARWNILCKSIKDKKLYVLNLFDNEELLVNIEAITEDTINNKLLEGEYLINKEINYMFNKESINEINYSALEDSINRFEEINNGKRNSELLRTRYDRLFPSKEKLIKLIYKTQSNDSIKNFLNVTIHKIESFENKMKNEYPFHLIYQNCTTEIFSMFESIEKQGIDLNKILGGKIKHNDLLIFIPFVAFDQVYKRYNVDKSEEIYSYRIKYLKTKIKEKLEEKLIESNTITSKLYKFNPDDTWFIFFTDDTIIVRPIFGIVNMFAGVSEFAFGIIYMPADRGAHFQKGMQGIFFSIPELFFFNIRKGTFSNASWKEGEDE